MKNDHVIPVVITSILLMLCIMTNLSGEDSNNFTPLETAILWNASLFYGDIETARKITSSKSDKFIKSIDGSFEELSKSSRNLFKNFPDFREIHTEIIGQKAVVIRRCKFSNGDIKYYIDTLFLEDNIWKLAPEYEQIYPLKITK